MHTQGNSHSSVKFDLCTKYITVTAHYTTWQLISDRKDRRLQQQAQTGAGTTTLSWLTHHTANIYENIKHKYEGSPVTAAPWTAHQSQAWSHCTWNRSAAPWSGGSFRQAHMYLSVASEHDTHTFKWRVCMDDCSRFLMGAERGGEVVNIIHPWEKYTPSATTQAPERQAAGTLSPRHIHWKQCMRQ